MFFASILPSLPLSPIPIRVASYNIRHGVGMDNQLDLSSTVGTLRSINADFVGLQEVDHTAKRSLSVDQAKFLGKDLNMRAAFGEFMPFDGGQYGLGMLAKHPLTNIRALRLPDGNEPRVALLADLKLPGGNSILVANVHFDWVEDDGFRFAQAEVVAKQLRKSKKPFVLLGDFNDGPNSRTLALFREFAQEVKKPAGGTFTFPADKPEKEIDYIFVSPRDRWRVNSILVWEEKVASDHRPVIADLELLP